MSIQSDPPINAVPFPYLTETNNIRVDEKGPVILCMNIFRNLDFGTGPLVALALNKINPKSKNKIDVSVLVDDRKDARWHLIAKRALVVISWRMIKLVGENYAFLAAGSDSEPVSILERGAAYSIVPDDFPVLYQISPLTAQSPVGRQEVALAPFQYPGPPPSGISWLDIDADLEKTEWFAVLNHNWLSNQVYAATLMSGLGYASLVDSALNWLAPPFAGSMSFPHDLEVGFLFSSAGINQEWLSVLGYTAPSAQYSLCFVILPKMNLSQGRNVHGGIAANASIRMQPLSLEAQSFKYSMKLNILDQNQSICSYNRAWNQHSSVLFSGPSVICAGNQYLAKAASYSLVEYEGGFSADETWDPQRARRGYDVCDSDAGGSGRAVQMPSVSTAAFFVSELQGDRDFPPMKAFSSGRGTMVFLSQDLVPTLLASSIPSLCSPEAVRAWFNSCFSR